MKKYLQNLIWKPIAISATAAALICALWLPHKAAVIVVPGIVLICGGYFLLNRACQNVVKKTAPTSYFQDLRWRNMEAILVGSTQTWKYAEFDRGKCYDATGFRRSNAMCYHMLRTYHSHVKRGGTVLYVVDPAESQSIGDYISPSDFLHIHPHVFLKLGVSYSPRQQANPLIYARRYSIAVLIQYVLKAHMNFRGKTWSICKDKLSEQDAAAIGEQLRCVIEFCSERDLHCKVVLIQRTPSDVSGEMRLASLVKEKAECVVVTNPAELNLELRLSTAI